MFAELKHIRQPKPQPTPATPATSPDTEKNKEKNIIWQTQQKANKQRRQASVQTEQETDNTTIVTPTPHTTTIQKEQAKHRLFTAE